MPQIEVGLDESEYRDAKPDAKHYGQMIHCKSPWPVPFSSVCRLRNCVRSARPDLPAALSSTGFALPTSGMVFDLTM